MATVTARSFRPAPALAHRRRRPLAPPKLETDIERILGNDRVEIEHGQLAKDTTMAVIETSWLNGIVGYMGPMSFVSAKKLAAWQNEQFGSDLQTTRVRRVRCKVDIRIEFID